MRRAGLAITGALAIWFGGAALVTVANHVFEFAPDKVSAGTGLTVGFALVGLVLGGIAAFCFYRIWLN